MKLHELIVKLSANIGEFRDRDLITDFELMDIVGEINRWLKALENYHKKNLIPVPFDEWVKKWSEEE